MKKEKISKEGEAKMGLEAIRKERDRAKRIAEKDVKSGTVSPRTYFFDGRWSAFDQVIKKLQGHAPGPGGSGPRDIGEGPDGPGTDGKKREV